MRKCIPHVKTPATKAEKVTKISNTSIASDIPINTNSLIMNPAFSVYVSMDIYNIT